MKRIPIAGPWITEREVEYAADAARRAWYEHANEYPARFEAGICAYVGSRHAIALPHATAALRLSLAAFGVGPGDEVIVPDATWIASSAPISHLGATPVFADIEEESWCLSASSLESCITPRTRAVIPVDLYGGMPEMDAIADVAAAHGIRVIEDAAEAIGSEYRGRKAGSLGDTGVFSFHGSKTLVTGEGGMLVTDSDEIQERVLFLRDHGRPPGDRVFLNTEIAYKEKMSALQAAVGVAQLERITELVECKRKLFAWYREALGDIPGLRLNPEPEGTRNSYWMVTIVLDPAYGIFGHDLMGQLSDAGIDSRPFFQPLSSIPAYADSDQARVARERNVVSQRICPYGINLPSALILTEDQVAYVSDAVKRALGR